MKQETGDLQSFPFEREAIPEIIALVAQEAETYLEQLPDRPVRAPGGATFPEMLAGELAQSGVGATEALKDLWQNGLAAATHSSGPRFFHFVTGGVTPAAMGADWLATLLDQFAFNQLSSPLAVGLEEVSLAWLKSLFGLSPGMGGIITTGATMANFVGLAAARQWWGERQGVDVAQDGLASMPRTPIFSSGILHASAVKALAMLGMGRSAVQTFSKDGSGQVDLGAMEMALRGLKGMPAIIIGNAGEVNSGAFDPIEGLADLAQQYNAWYHVDGAFGLFAALSPRTSHLTAGADRADSVTVDGHKWLNVPYDAGFSFVKDSAFMRRAFAYSASYLESPGDEGFNPGSMGPEGSRRARSLAVWATLRAYGRKGYQALVEGCLDLAQQLAQRVDEAPELERLAAVPLNIVCFRANPGGKNEAALNGLNRRLGKTILEDGRFYAGTTEYDGKVALRPAIVNWRTGPAEIDQFVDVVRELANSL
jgi:glutamate/tyrosine decarboxylase-like PLP-dependent enzyme